MSKQLNDEFIITFMEGLKSDVEHIRTDVSQQAADISKQSVNIALLAEGFKRHVEADIAVAKTVKELEEKHHNEKSRIYTIFGIVVAIVIFILGYFTNNTSNNITNERQPIIHSEKSKKDITSD